MKLSAGDTITCKHAVEAYYSGVSGHPRIKFPPGMVGKVACVCPKVTIRSHPPELHDTKETMVVLDFFSPTTRAVERASLNHCNVRRIKGETVSPGPVTFYTIRYEYLHDKDPLRLVDLLHELYGGDKDRILEMIATNDPLAVLSTVAELMG